MLIRDRNPDGRGRGKLGERVALISQAHPNERVRVRIDKWTRNTAQGRVATLIGGEPGRIAHACAHEFKCTGCPMLAAHPNDEKRFKEGLVENILSQLNLRGAESIQRPSSLFGYRHLSKQVFARQGNRTVLGAYVTGTHRVTDNLGCPILVPELAELMRTVARTVERARLSVDERGKPGLRYAVGRQSRSTGQQLLLLVTSGEPEPVLRLCGELSRSHPRLRGAMVLHDEESGDALLKGSVAGSCGAVVIEEELLGYRHELTPISFFQVNPQAAEYLLGAACDAAGSGNVCLEGYAGVGAMTLPLSERFSHVIAIESVPEAVSALRRGAAAAGRPGIEALNERVEDVLDELLLSRKPETVVLDPPRKGLGHRVAANVASSGVSRVILLHCAPSRLKRDLPPLLSAGFSLRRCLPVDQFSRTAHVETLTVLER